MGRARKPTADDKFVRFDARGQKAAASLDGLLRVLCHECARPIAVVTITGATFDDGPVESPSVEVKRRGTLPLKELRQTGATLPCPAKGCLTAGQRIDWAGLEWLSEVYRRGLSGDGRGGAEYTAGTTVERFPLTDPAG